MCPRYIDPDLPWPWARMTADQRRTRMLADERQHTNTVALLRYQVEVERTRHAGPVPTQRGPADDLPPLRRTQSMGGYYREALMRARKGRR